MRRQPTQALGEHFIGPSVLPSEHSGKGTNVHGISEIARRRSKEKHIMAVDENTSSSTGNLQDNLETITGISPRKAEALSHIGIHRLDDLAESTPDSWMTS